jgi:hypothetical protein
LLGFCLSKVKKLRRQVFNFLKKTAHRRPGVDPIAGAAGIKADAGSGTNFLFVKNTLAYSAFEF